MGVVTSEFSFVDFAAEETDGAATSESQEDERTVSDYLDSGLMFGLIKRTHQALADDRTGT